MGERDKRLASAGVSGKNLMAHWRRRLGLPVAKRSKNPRLCEAAGVRPRF